MATTLNPALIALIEKLGAALRPRPKKPNATEDERAGPTCSPARPGRATGSASHAG